MSFVLEPINLLVAIIASWVNRQQQESIDYLVTQCQVLIETHGPKRILLTDDQRRRLAVTGKNLGRKRLEEIGTLFTPDTILRWHRTLVAQKWDYSHKRAKKLVGRPAVSEKVTQLVLRMAKENPTWAYDRIQGGPHWSNFQSHSSHSRHRFSESQESIVVGTVRGVAWPRPPALALFLACV
jgi:hypothetical protein